jgi:BspA type Leucine rich repeat region (6 copies)
VSKVSTLNTLPKGLKCLSLDDCPGIATLDRLPCTKLTELILANCNSDIDLRNLPSTVPRLEKLTLVKRSNTLTADMLPATLQGLTLQECSYLTELNCTRLDTLKTITLRKCHTITTVDVSKCLALTSFTLEDTSIMQLILPEDDSVLSKLNLTECKKLIVLSLSDQINLEEVTLIKCNSLREIKDLGAAIWLTSLLIDDCGLERLTLPGDQHTAYTVRLYKCEQLSVLHLDKGVNLDRLTITDCKALCKLKGRSDTAVIKALHISKCQKLQYHEIAVLLSTVDLNELILDNQSMKKFRYDGERNSQKLRSITLSNCTTLIKVNLVNCTSLKALTLELCNSVTKLRVFNCTSLCAVKVNELSAQGPEVVAFRDCPELQTLSLKGYTGLRTLELYRCGMLYFLNDLLQLAPTLTLLHVQHCTSIECVEGLEGLKSLTSLSFNGCSSLLQVPSLREHSKLTFVELKGCASLTAVPLLPKHIKQSELDLTGCSELPEYSAAKNAQTTVDALLVTATLLAALGYASITNTTGNVHIS